jgi:SAM-dependent methyltransferase
MDLQSAANQWNERYKQPEYAYGTEPNVFFQQQLHTLPVGRMLLPAEGEGRNAVYAAQKGWEVHAFDISIEGKNKALQLANQKNVTIHYLIGQITELHYPPESFDALAIIYNHFPTPLKNLYFPIFHQLLKKKGTLIMEVFSKKHLEYNHKNPKVGGPKELDWLYSLEEVKTFFPNYKMLILEETEIELNEGIYHVGKASVIRMVAQK